MRDSVTRIQDAKTRTVPTQAEEVIVAGQTNKVEDFAILKCLLAMIVSEIWSKTRLEAKDTGMCLYLARYHSGIIENAISLEKNRRRNKSLRETQTVNRLNSI
jgi:hypothetical protein